MKRLSEFIKWYIYITISILVVCTIIFGAFSSGDTMPVDTLWQILLSGFLTTLVTILMVITECTKKYVSVIKYVLHYVLLCAVMILCGNWFGWIRFELYGVVMMAGAVAVVYILAFGVYYLIDLKQANEINQKLKEKYRDAE